MRDITIEVLRGWDASRLSVVYWVEEHSRRIAAMFGQKVPEDLDLDWYCKRGRVTLAWRGGEIIGCMMVSPGRSVWDSRLFLYQDLLYAVGYGAAYALLRDCVEFAKSKGYMVHAVDASGSNGKGLKRLGFKRLETVYRWE